MSSKRLDNNWDHNLSRMDEEINLLCGESKNGSERIAKTLHCFGNLCRQYGDIQQVKRTRQVELLQIIARFIWMVDFHNLKQDLADSLERRGKRRCGRSTTIEHLVIESATEVSAATRSRWARVIREARTEKVVPGKFCKWLKACGGVSGVLNSKNTVSAMSASSSHSKEKSKKTDVDIIRGPQLGRLLNEELREKEREHVDIRFYLSDNDVVDYKVMTT